MKRGALVEARFGKGRWIYLALGLWRQLPAGTDGAYQLLANLISVGKAPDAGEGASEVVASPADVLVVGAGPAGATAARALALGGARVRLLDRARFPRNKPCGGGITTRALGRFPVSRRPRSTASPRTGSPGSTWKVRRGAAWS